MSTCLPVLDPPIPVSQDSTRALRKGGSTINARDAIFGSAATTATLAVPADADRAPVTQPTTTSFHSYQLGTKIGAGGMGAVYRATHAYLGRTLAIKFISPSILDSPEAVARFRHEALAIGQLDHPNIIRATDAGLIDGIHYLVTEFVGGEDLASYVHRAGPLAIADACEAVRQAALGLAHAHETGIVHRDVKPANLLLSDDGTIKLLDFGLARVASGQTALTSTGQVLGTLDFLAPEQASDARNVDPRGDQYSLGCTLYFLLTGEPPFSGPAYETPASKLKAHLIDRPRPVTELRRRIPLALAATLDRMLAKTPGDRFPSLAEVERALAPFCRGANLMALVNPAGAASAARRSTAIATTPSAIGEIAERTAAVLGWALRGAFYRGATPASAPPRRQPFFSLSGIVVLAFFGFILSRVSCVEIKQEKNARGAKGKPEETEVIEFGFGNIPPPAAFTGKQGR